MPWIDASTNTLDKISQNGEQRPLQSNYMTSFSAPQIENVGTETMEDKDPGLDDTQDNLQHTDIEEANSQAEIQNPHVDSEKPFESAGQDIGDSNAADSGEEAEETQAFLPDTQEQVTTV